MSWQIVFRKLTKKQQTESICTIGIATDLFIRIIIAVAAANYNVDPVALEGICRYESDHGRVLAHQNKNGSWDVGFCQNHRPKSNTRPPIPTITESIFEAAEELAYWKHQHTRFCVKMYNRRETCGFRKYGSWHGIKRCWRDHSYIAHYNHGFRVLANNYGRKVLCLMNNNFQKC